MRSFSRLFRVPRPKKFLGCISLEIATEVITVLLAFNKATGVYGLLAILTGYSLNALQIPTYLYCVVVIACLGYLLPHIRRQSPFQMLTLAWLYILDSFVNFTLTISFAVTWYVARAAEDAQVDDPVASQTPLKVTGGNLTAKSTLSMPQDTAFSIILIAFVTLSRFYLCFVIAAYTQRCIRRHINGSTVESNDPMKLLGAPFDEENANGYTNRGKLARLMIKIGRSYWLDSTDQDEWARSMNARFRKNAEDVV